MLTRMIGALARGLLVALVVATPALVLPLVQQDTTEIVALIALFAFLLTTVEYGSSYPSLIEFRDAPPFNRVRFLTLFMIVFLVSSVARGEFEATSFSLFAEAVGMLIGQVLDVPFSPIRLMLEALPENADPNLTGLMCAAAGIATLVSLLALAIFATILGAGGWPSARGFNVWINLPTFDPSSGGDVVYRLRRDARFNIVLGGALPFLLPAVMGAGSGVFGDGGLQTAHTLVWVVAAWAFLPTSLFMRGIAMGRIATMIEARRRLGLRPESAILLA